MMKTKTMMNTKLLYLALITTLLLVLVVSKPVYAQSGEEVETTAETEPTTESTTKTLVETTEEEIEIKYPNKLNPVTPPNEVEENTNTGIRTEQSNARATVVENVNNANNDYPVYRGSVEDSENADTNSEDQAISSDDLIYAADARQFITFMTKNGKTFHLIINHDETGENVMLLTEVSEDDLLNMIEVKEDDTPTKVDDVETQEVVKEEPVKEEKSNIGTYVVMALALILALGAGYYFKVVKKKEDEELASFEEPDDDFISEAEDMNESEDELAEDELL